jgi:hypothetical protein
MGDQNIFMWLLLVIFAVLCTYWHFRENKELASQWHKNLGEEPAQWLIRFAWSRTVQLLSTLICCVLVIIVYDWQLSEARHAIYTSRAKEVAEAKQRELEKTMIKPEQPQNIPASSTPLQTTGNSLPTQLPMPQINSAGADTLDEIYNPESQSDNKQSTMDSIKKRYEDMLVTYFFLRKCNKADPADYHIIISALSQEMASVNAPGRMQNDILVSAQGSYKEMYEQSRCQDAGVNALSAQYSNYISNLSKLFLVK